MDTTTTTTDQQIQQINVVDDETLQAVLSSMNESEMNAFLEELNKTGKAYLPSIGQTIELLTMTTPTETSQDTALQELTSLLQQPPTDMVAIGSRQARTANTYGGTSVGSGNRPGTAVKSTITSNNSATVRKPVQQEQQQQGVGDDRMFFGRPGQQYNRTGPLPHKQGVSSISSGGQQQRRPISWFHNRSRRHSSDDDDDSDRDLSPPSYSFNSGDNLGPTRRSARVPKPKQDADFVTFPLLDRNEQGNPIPPSPSSMPLHKADDDEDDIPYRLMDYTRPSQQSQSPTASSSTSIGPGRKARTVAELRTAAAQPTKKQVRWPDDELYHVKSNIPLIMPQQITHPSIMKNKMTMCKPLVFEREVEAKPTRFTIATQTEIEHMIPDVSLVSLPVPIYLPSPTPSYRLFQPKAVPIPVPVYIPIMIPVPKSAYKNIRDYLQTQRDLLPDDPYQAALIMHAESLVRAENQAKIQPNESVVMTDLIRDDTHLARGRVIESLPELDLEAHYIDPVSSSDPEIRKFLEMLPDANDRLKWTYGVSAFQHWTIQHNQKETSNSILIKSDLLSYSTGNELQHILDLFLREIRRPIGIEYLPESIYYLCLGIQFYLKINNHSIDIFNPCYIEFNSTLTKILSNYSPRISSESNQYISLIDEDLLYDIHQFGTVTPWSLLTTLIYINTKYFNLKTVQSHQSISFANFGKYSQWERLPSNVTQGQQKTYLRFYAHNSDLKSLVNSPVVYEISEQVNDVVRCPIKQYDFYISKCPEQIRGTADVFYLHPLFPDNQTNSIWFSSEPLSSLIVDQILTRLKLLPDFYHQTKPVETTTTTVATNFS